MFFFRKVKFILISTQRTGSTLLCDYLSSHKKIYMGKELFKPNGVGYNNDNDGFFAQNKEFCIENFLDQFFDKYIKDYNAVGFKIMADQLEKFPEILNYIIKKKIRCIFLYRDNILKVALSRLKARETKLYHSNSIENIDGYNIDEKKLLVELDLIERSINYLMNLENNLNVKKIVLEYECFLTNIDSELVKIQKFLKVRTENDLKSSLKKLTNNNLNESILNYKEIYQVLKFSKYVNYLDEYLIAKNDLIFIHIPKVAGTSIEKALFSTKGKVGHKKAIDYIQKGNVFYEKFSFAFVRNPYDRLVSSFHYLKNGGRNRFDKEWSDTNLAEFNTFEQFVLSLKNEDKKNKILDWMHFIPQYKFVCDSNENIITDFIGKFEMIKEDFFPFIRGGYANNLPHENLSKHDEYKKYYTKELYEIVNDIYKKDFDLFYSNKNDELKNLLNNINKNNTVIVTFVNYNYKDVLENWLNYINFLNIKNYLIVSLDEEIYKVLRLKNINTILRKCENNLERLWIHRIKILREILMLNYNIIHSDVDAIWLKNPLENYFYNNEYDMIFSQGTFWPKDVHAKWNFVLCCGFFYVKSNFKTLNFFKNYLLRVIEENDDQVSLNRLIDELQVKWDFKNDYDLEYNGISFNCSNKIVEGVVNGLNIALLPHNLFQRINEKEKKAYIKHIISEKNFDSKLKMFEEVDCLFKGKK